MLDCFRECYRTLFTPSPPREVSLSVPTVRVYNATTARLGPSAPPPYSPGRGVTKHAVLSDGMPTEVDLVDFFSPFDGKICRADISHCTLADQRVILLRSFNAQADLKTITPPDSESLPFFSLAEDPLSGPLEWSYIHLDPRYVVSIISSERVFGEQIRVDPSEYSIEITDKVTRLYFNFMKGGQEGTFCLRLSELDQQGRASPAFVPSEFYTFTEPPNYGSMHSECHGASTCS